MKLVTEICSGFSGNQPVIFEYGCKTIHSTLLMRLSYIFGFYLQFYIGILFQLKIYFFSTQIVTIFPLMVIWNWYISYRMLYLKHAKVMKEQVT
jgi:hypothetical protein